MKIKYCSICKKEPIKFFRICDFNHKKWFICSKECYQNYLSQVWGREKNYSQQTKPLLEDVKGKDMHPNKMHTSSHKELLKTADKHIPQETEEYPDY